MTVNISGANAIESDVLQVPDSHPTHGSELSDQINAILAADAADRAVVDAIKKRAAEKQSSTNDYFNELNVAVPPQPGVSANGPVTPRGSPLNAYAPDVATELTRPGFANTDVTSAQVENNAWVDWAILSVVAIAALAVLWLIRSDRDRLFRWGNNAMSLVRKRAAAVICAGAALFIADATILNELLDDRYYRDLHEAGWIAFFGASLALIGVYHWIARTDMH